MFTPAQLGGLMKNTTMWQTFVVTGVALVVGMPLYLSANQDVFESTVTLDRAQNVRPGYTVLIFEGDGENVYECVDIPACDLVLDGDKVKVTYNNPSMWNGGVYRVKDVAILSD